MSLNLKTLAKAAVVTLGVLVLVAVIASKGDANGLPQSRCDAAKAEAAGAKAEHLLKGCVKTAFQRGVSPSSHCMDEVRQEFEEAFDKAEEKGDCTAYVSVEQIECKVDCLVEDITCELAGTCYEFSLDECVYDCSGMDGG